MKIVIGMIGIFISFFIIYYIIKKSIKKIIEISVMKSVNENKIGTCFVCNKGQTNNKYDYYTADEVGSGVTYGANVKMTTIRYANFEKHSAFVCAQCAGDEILDLGCMFLICGIIFSLPYFIDDTCPIGILIFGMSTLLLGLWQLTRYIRRLRDDVRFKIKGSLVAKGKERSNPKHSGKCLFSEYEYQNLSKTFV